MPTFFSKRLINIRKMFAFLQFLSTVFKRRIQPMYTDGHLQDYSSLLENTDCAAALTSKILVRNAYALNYKQYWYMHGPVESVLGKKRSLYGEKISW